MQPPADTPPQEGAQKKNQADITQQVDPPAASQEGDQLREAAGLADQLPQVDSTARGTENKNNDTRKYLKYKSKYINLKRTLNLI